MASLLARSGARGARAAATAAANGARAFWAGVPMAPVDPILGVTEAFKADTNPLKMNVGVGAYRDDDGKPVVLDCVRTAEKKVAGNFNMEYLPIVGDREFVNEALKVAYGDDAACLKDGRTAAIQSLSGTGSCRLIAEFMQRFAPGAKIYIPTPTWSNHHNIWRDAGVEEVKFRYYDPATRGLDFAGMMEDVHAAPKGSFFLLHACAHNPTGVDPSAEQWAELSALMKEKELFPIFDSAYQGFASGDFVRDGAAVTKFLEDGHKLALSQSFAKVRVRCPPVHPTPQLLCLSDIRPSRRTLIAELRYVRPAHRHRVVRVRRRGRGVARREPAQGRGARHVLQPAAAWCAARQDCALGPRAQGAVVRRGQGYGRPHHLHAHRPALQPRGPGLAAQLAAYHRPDRHVLLLRHDPRAVRQDHQGLERLPHAQRPHLDGRRDEQERRPPRGSDSRSDQVKACVRRGDRSARGRLATREATPRVAVHFLKMRGAPRLLPRGASARCCHWHSEQRMFPTVAASRAARVR